MISSSEAFTSLKAGSGRVIVAGGRVLESTGIGTVEGTVKSLDGRFVPIKFTDVLLVPDLGANLLSVKTLVAKGAKVIFAEVCSLH
jgi:hypothetical protein